jgi:hypothetical protein
MSKQKGVQGRAELLHELRETLVKQDQAHRDIQAAAREAAERLADVSTRLRQIQTGKIGDGLTFEERLQAALEDTDAVQTLEGQQQGLSARARELEALEQEARRMRDHTAAKLRTVRAEMMQADWRAAVQAQVDALALVCRASAAAEALRRELAAEGLTRVHSSVLDTFSLQGMPASRDPWHKMQHREGLPIAKFLHRAEQIGCDMTRLDREITAAAAAIAQPTTQKRGAA